MAKILLFEDDAMDGEFFSGYVRHGGHDLQWEMDPQAVRRIIEAKETDFDLALFDVRVPGASRIGLDLAAQWDQSQGLPFMFLTGVYQSPADLKRFKDAPNYKGLVVKSQTTRDELLRKITEALR